MDNGNTIEYTLTDPDQDPIVGSGHGISISGSAAIGNTIEGNDISGNQTDGIRIGESASLNVIGDATAGTHNLISENVRGVSIESNSFSNQVVDNYIGTDEDGNSADDAGNTLGGVALTDANNNIVQGNTIRDNPIGVGMANADTTGNRVIGNVISNSSSEGVQITRGAASNVIGGTTADNRNLISANCAGRLNRHECPRQQRHRKLHRHRRERRLRRRLGQYKRRNRPVARGSQHHPGQYDPRQSHRRGDGLLRHHRQQAGR